jgi:tripartite-type tricarboxylate transporter receptor subunit TctC
MSFSEGLRRAAARLLEAGLLALCLAGAASAQAFPDGPVRIVIPFPPGGTTDVAARYLAQLLNAEWQQPVIVENQSGASGIIAAQTVARAAPNGLTLLLAADPVLATNPLLFSKLPYDPDKDFAPVGTLYRFGLAIVANAAVPAKSLRELVEQAKANPGMLNYGTTGVGSNMHLTMELFKHLSGIDLVHVPYRGCAQVASELAAGRIAVSAQSVGAASAAVKAGHARVLAVDGRQRWPAFPDAPTFAEAGYPAMQAPVWAGGVVPRGTPPHIIERLNAALVMATRNAGFRDRLATMGMQPVGDSPAEFARLIQETRALWAPVIKAANIRLD